MTTVTKNSNSGASSDNNSGDAWLNPTYIYADDDSYTTSTNSSDHTDFLTTGFESFSLTDADDINSVTANIKGKIGSGITAHDGYIKFRTSSSDTWCSGHTFSDFTTSEENRTISCSHKTWTYSNVDTMEVEIYFENVSGIDKIYIDHVYMDVDYTTTTVPSAPSAPTFTSVSTSGGDDSGNLTVSCASPDDGGRSLSDVTFEIDDNTSFNNANGNFHTWTLGSAPSDPQTHEFTGLANGTTFYARAKYENSNGWGSYNTSYNSEETYDYPSVPQNVALSATGENTLLLTWSASADDGGTTIINYEYTYGGVEYSAGTSYSTTISGLTAGTQYSVAIRARNAVGASSYSSYVSKYTYTEAPTITQFEPKSFNSAELSWDTVTGASSYKIEIQTNDGGWSTYATGITDNTNYAIESLTEDAEIDVRVTGMNPDNVYGTTSAISTLFITETGFGLLQYKIIQTSPLFQIVRCWIVNSYDQDQVYNRTLNGTYWVFDIIMEAGKRSFMIVPKFQYHNQYAIGLLSSLFFNGSSNVAVLGMNELKFSDVDGLIENESFDEPIVLMFNWNDSKIIGIGANKTISMYAQDNSTNKLIESIALSDIKDKHNEKYFYTVFTNKFIDVNDNDLQLYYDGADFTGQGTENTSSTSGDGACGFKSSGYDTIDFTSLKTGVYKILIRHRVASSITDNIQVTMSKGSTVIEDYGYISGNKQTSFSATNTSYETLNFNFTVFDESSTYTLKLLNVDTSNMWYIDSVVIIPLSNGQEFIMDLYMQGLTTNKSIYIGKV